MNGGGGRGRTMSAAGGCRARRFPRRSSASPIPGIAPQPGLTPLAALSQLSNPAVNPGTPPPQQRRHAARSPRSPRALGTLQPFPDHTRGARTPADTPLPAPLGAQNAAFSPPPPPHPCGSRAPPSNPGPSPQRPLSFQDPRILEGAASSPTSPRPSPAARGSQGTGGSRVASPLPFFPSPPLPPCPSSATTVTQHLGPRPPPPPREHPNMALFAPKPPPSPNRPIPAVNHPHRAFLLVQTARRGRG